MTTTERGTRAQQKDRTREDIRAAALDLFERQGFGRTTIDEIVAAASVGRRTFFRYFSCKEALLFSEGVYTGLPADLEDELSNGVPPVRALLAALDSDAYGSSDPDEITVRRRRLRIELLRTEPSVGEFYRAEIARIASAVTDTLRRHPASAAVPMLPELVGGFLSTMVLEHLESGETHHFSVDVKKWRTAVRALEASFDG
jgi:AcrR family transcriptional regulator